MKKSRPELRALFDDPGLQARMETLVQAQAPGLAGALNYEQLFVPLLSWLVEQNRPYLLGISGGQGSGKSTLARLVAWLLKETLNWRVAVLSLDDFYLTQAERSELAQRIHPLLATRGVPGTHDISLLAQTLAELRCGQPRRIRLPRFSKVTDDRCPSEQDQLLENPYDLVLLEGWCVGASAQAEAQLDLAVNELEREQDPDGRWRRFVNGQLAGPYATVFERLDGLLFLKVPGFEQVRQWRLAQEQALAGGPLHSAEAIQRFCQHFERLTAQMCEELPAKATATVQLNKDHGFQSLSWR